MALIDTAKQTFGGAFSGSSFSSAGSIFTFLAFILIISLIIGVSLFFIIQALKYKYRITVFENISGKGYSPTGKDRAKLIKAGDGGEVVLYLRKRKVYRKAYGKKIGKNHLAFLIGDDGYWYNIEFGDFDKNLKELNINPVDPDMRHFNVAIRRNISQRFDQKNWFKENVGLIVGIISIVLVLVFIWLIFREFSSITSGAEQAVRASKEVMELAKEVLGAVDNLKSGSGVARV